MDERLVKIEPDLLRDLMVVERKHFSPVERNLHAKRYRLQLRMERAERALALVIGTHWTLWSCGDCIFALCVFQDVTNTTKRSNWLKRSKSSVSPCRRWLMHLIKQGENLRHWLPPIEVTRQQHRMGNMPLPSQRWWNKVLESVWSTSSSVRRIGLVKYIRLIGREIDL